MTGLGNNIATCRKRVGLTQEQLAEKCGVSRQAITKWESDGSEPDVSKLCLLADLFGIEVDTLLGRETSSVITEKEERVFKRVALTIKGVYDDNDKGRRDTSDISRKERKEYERKMREAEEEREWDMLMMLEVMSED